MLKLENVNVSLQNQKDHIIHNISFDIEDGSTHIIMGPNGAGKSTLFKALMHHPSYTITGNITYNGKDINSLTTDKIAKLGIYYINQTPSEIEGITNIEMLRTSLIDKGEKVDIFKFNKECQEICHKLNLPKSFLHRSVNQGMSGGERKKNELFGMWVLKPSLVILDEIDSGLDVDALKLVADNLLEYQKVTNASIILVTHQPAFLEIFKDAIVHVLKDGFLVEQGTVLLGQDIIKNGFSKYDVINEISDEESYE